MARTTKGVKTPTNPFLAKRKVKKMITDPQESDLDLIANAIFYGGIPEVTIQQPYENPNFGIVSASWDGYSIIVDYDEYPSIRMKFRTQEERDEHAMDEFYEPTDIIDLVQAVVEDVTFFNKNNEDYYHWYSTEKSKKFNPFFAKKKVRKSKVKKYYVGVRFPDRVVSMELEGEGDDLWRDIDSAYPKSYDYLNENNLWFYDDESFARDFVDDDELFSMFSKVQETAQEGSTSDVQAPQDDLTDIEKRIAQKRTNTGATLGDLEKMRAPEQAGPINGKFQPFANNYRTIQMTANPMNPVQTPSTNKIKRI